MDWRKLQAHPIAAALPMLDFKRLASLAVDIHENGQQVPITLTNEEEPRILDGRNRLEAFRLLERKGELKFEPIFESYSGPLSPEEFVHSRNLERRHLSDAWLLKYAEKRVMKAREAALARMMAGKPVPEAEAGKATEVVAKELNVPARQIEKIARVRKDAPELYEKIGTPGGPTVSGAYAQVVNKAKREKQTPEEKAFTKELNEFFAGVSGLEHRARELKLGIREIPKLDDADLRRWMDVSELLQRQLREIDSKLQG